MCFAHNDEGNPVRECKAMHEDKFRCSWLRNTVEESGQKLWRTRYGWPKLGDAKKV